MKIIPALHSIIKWIINHGKEQNREEEEEEPEFIFTAYKEWRWRFLPPTPHGDSWSCHWRALFATITRPIFQFSDNSTTIRPHIHTSNRVTNSTIYDFMIVNTTLTQPHMPYDQPHTQSAQSLGKYGSLGYNYCMSSKRLMPPLSVFNVI